MSLDYYAFRKSKIDKNSLGQAEPHLAYLWYEALGSKQKDEVRDAWQESLAVADNPWREGHFDFCKLPDDFGFTPDASAVAWLPPYSFMLQVPFQLHKPFLSKDERDFYLLDNPLRREKVFKTPMAAASGWKGALRAAMVQQLAHWWGSLEPDDRKQRSNRKAFVAKRCQLARLFGAERDTQVDGEEYGQYLDELGGEHQARWFRRYLRSFVSKNALFAGCLYFYPTFFDQAGLEVVNPHDRRTGTGIIKRGPILVECVPNDNDAKGELVLVYVPFAPLKQDGRKTAQLLAHDVEALAEGIKGMLTLYGFGAKTSSGFGTAMERLVGEGRLVLRAALASDGKPASPLPGAQLPDLPRYLEAPNRLLSELRRPDFSLKDEKVYRQWVESSGRKYNKDKQQLYAKAKAWWEREGRLLAEEGRPAPEAEQQAEIPKAPPIATYTFRSLDELCSKTREAAKVLQEGDRNE